MDLNPSTSDYVRAVLVPQGSVPRLVRRWATRPEQLDIDAAVTALWKLLTGELRLLRKTELRNRNEVVLAEGYQVDAEKVLVQPGGGRVRCATCQRVTTRTAPKGACVGYHCGGRTVEEPTDANNYDVWLMGRPFTMVTPEEHTARPTTGSGRAGPAARSGWPSS